MDENHSFSIAAKIAARAWEDPAYKKKLLENPKAVFQEAGFKVPPGITIKILENTKTTHYFVLPEKPDDLTQEDLMVSGGGWHCSPY